VGVRSKMLYSKDNLFVETQSPHSLGLKNSMTIPSPGFDQNQLMINEKRFWGAGLQGLSFDGSGLFGTGLFAGDIATWGVSEFIFGLIGAYAVYAMFHQTKQTKYRLEMGAGRRRKSRAKKLREKAKRLEEQTEGIF
jgi:hypothetical protein